MFPECLLEENLGQTSVLPMVITVHSSLVDYLAQLTYAKNCPTTFYCIFQLVWVPMTTTQNIRLSFKASLSKGPYEESVF